MLYQYMIIPCSSSSLAWHKTDDECLYKCRLRTRELPQWVPLSRATAREETEMHSIRVRDLDRPPTLGFHSAHHSSNPASTKEGVEPLVANFNREGGE